MHIILCEDEPYFADILQKDLKTCLNEREISHEIFHCPSGASLITFLKESPCADLLFLDIQLGDCDGVELAAQIRKNHPALTIVFLTSMEDRIAEGYDVNAFSFLFKRNYLEKLPHLLDRYISEIYQKKSLAIREKGSLHLLAFQDIYYLEASRRATAVHTASEVFQDSTSIQNFAKLLPAESFLEVYHALYVNVDHIDRVDTDTLTLDNQITIPVSRRKRRELMSAIMRRIQNR